MSDQNHSPENKENASLARMNRGMEIAEKASICEMENGAFSVPSATVEEIAYLVRLIDGQYVCNCLDFKQRHQEVGFCKHIHAVKFWIASQTFLQEKSKPKVFADDAVQCPKCASIRVVRNGHDSGKQVFKCRDCSHKFREISLLKKAQYSPELVSLTLDLYFSGMSLRKIARTISNHYDQSLGYTTIYSWIQKYVPKISEYVNSLEPQLSGTWHADELFVKMKKGTEYKDKGNIAFLWNVMDRKTRFLLASKLSRFRDGDGATRAFRQARENAHGQEPESILADSLNSYIQGVDYGFMDSKTQPKLIRNVGVNKPHATNNRIERLNGTLRERVKVQRGWKSMESQIAEGQRIHYNFVKPHMSLEKQTPAQRAGIVIGSKNKWLGLLEEAITRN